MKTKFKNQKSGQAGSALMLTMILGAIALAILAGVMTWSASSARLTHRSIQYTRSTAAAEAATEKVVSQIKQDFLYGGENLVVSKLNSYRQNTAPAPADSSYWNNWEFNDGNGNLGQTYVQRTPGTYVVLDSTYAGLKGYVTTYTVVSHARDRANLQDVTAGVLQQLQLVGVPIFQFMLYSSSDMEISCGQPFDVTGRVHANGHLYVEPDSSMTFESGVTAVLDILFQRDPLDTRGTPAGSAVYVHPDQKISPFEALTLPIGTTNTPLAIREIIQPPPTGEDPNSSIGRLRYYNQCDMNVTVSDTGITATTGVFDNFAGIPTNDLPNFISTTSSPGFWDAREGKTVRPIDINIGNLTAWSATNTSLRLIGGTNFILSSLYVLDTRTTLAANELGAVRVLNGTILPTNGLTVATARPLYVQGDYNEMDPSKLKSADTSATRPASLVADAISVLSQGWVDGTTSPGGSPPAAQPTTINAAFLTGVVETTLGQYSGGMENFPRFLENWGPTPFWYNGSMVRLFPSQFATGVWGQANVYNPPARNWAYDTNFDDPTKLPPKTPQLQKMIRGQWATVAPGTNAAAIFP